MTARQQLGNAGEDTAAAYLASLGYRIVARNVRGPAGEIDIVARDGTTFAFIEVKVRRSHRYGSALSAVDYRKRSRLRAAAADYLQFVAPGSRARFDVLTIDRGIMRLYRGAFG